jgi:hypothetical protein
MRSGIFLNEPQYFQKVKSSRPLARFPEQTKKAGGRSDSCDLYYAKAGYGDLERMDHTKPSSRGGWWVGTTPTMGGYETIASTSAKGAAFEFQKRNTSSGASALTLSLPSSRCCSSRCSYALFHTVPCTDPRARILETPTHIDMSNEQTRETMRSLKKSQQHASSWRSSYRFAAACYQRSL